MDHNLNVKCKAIKLLEINIKENLHVLDLGKKLLDMMLKVWPIREKTDKLDNQNLKLVFWEKYC